MSSCAFSRPSFLTEVVLVRDFVGLLCFLLFTSFFFSSRRRHTRYIGDWSSDVCSSDLYIFTDANGDETIVCNTLVAEGQEKLWHALFNNNDLSSMSFIFGAFAEVPLLATTFSAQFTSEPTIGVNGYARATEAATGWTITAVGSEVYAESPNQVFTASGGIFDKAFVRFFMALVLEEPSTTFTSYLVSYSSALAAAVTLLDTQSYTLKYRVYLK